MSTDPTVGVEARLAAGWKCPERVSTQGVRSPLSNTCGSTSNPRYVETCFHGGAPTGRTELRCTRHATMHEQRAARNAVYVARIKADNEQRARMQRETAIATNIAMLISDLTGRKVSGEAKRSGGSVVVALDLDSAKALLDHLRSHHE